MEFKMLLIIYILRVNFFIEKKLYFDFVFNGVICKCLLIVYLEKSIVWLFFWIFYRIMIIMRILYFCLLRVFVFVFY